MVVLFCKILTYWVYIAVFLLIGVLVRRRFLSFALSFGVMFLEVFLYTRLQMERPVSVAGPWTALMQLDRYIGRGDFLSYDFYFLFVPGVYVGVLALVIGYHVFRRGKMQTKSGSPGGFWQDSQESPRGRSWWQSCSWSADRRGVLRKKERHPWRISRLWKMWVR